MNPIQRYIDLKSKLLTAGYGSEIAWQTNLGLVSDPQTFRDEIVWVILNSGMREQVCRIILKRIWYARDAGEDISTAFNHVGKVKAIKFMFENCKRLFDEYMLATDKIGYLETIPFIGTITKYHAAKSLGLDVVKPDRHLVRIAKLYGFDDCNTLCSEISQSTGDKVSVVDIVLWRSANLGWI